MSAPRIDAVRKATNQTITDLAQLIEHLEDLHTLAYYRHADLSAKERVHGGDPTAIGIDLDNHGDPQARAAYTDLGHRLTHLHNTTTHLLEDTVNQFTTGIIATRTDRTADATATEILHALANRARRTDTPTIVTQPLPTGGRRLLDADRLTTELDALRSAVRKVHDDLRRQGRRPDKDRFTPLELTAWQTATGTAPPRRKKRR